MRLVLTPPRDLSRMAEGPGAKSTWRSRHGRNGGISSIWNTFRVI
jgi:hypothetical protein